MSRAEVRKRDLKAIREEVYLHEKRIEYRDSNTDKINAKQGRPLLQTCMTADQRRFKKLMNAPALFRGMKEITGPPAPVIPPPLVDNNAIREHQNEEDLDQQSDYTFRGEQGKKKSVK